jgi:hypothetical protein
MTGNPVEITNEKQKGNARQSLPERQKSASKVVVKGFEPPTLSPLNPIASDRFSERLQFAYDNLLPSGYVRVDLKFLEKSLATSLIMKQTHYSYLKLSTGFFTAAFAA